ncbi:MAG: hypothetical protein HQL94_07455 [Magnetococcales bacterium]|nr:hypothetical protein [Magnetococcales bacterium]
MEANLRKEMATLDANLKRDIKELEVRMDTKAESIQSELKRDIKELDVKMETRFKEQDAKMEVRFKELELRMVIKMGAMIIAAVGLMRMWPIQVQYVPPSPPHAQEMRWPAPSPVPAPPQVPTK